MPLYRLCAAVLLLACLGACASHRGASGGGGTSVASRGAYKVGAPYAIDGVTYVPQEEFNHVETGVASWYGPGFHGKSTANGEQYNQEDHTAAHRTLQMPAIVRVTNLDNGRSTVVRVNDRGPYARSRIIDLSRAAAQDLDIVRNGTAHVRIDQLPAESETVKEVALGGGGASEQQAALVQLAAGQRTAPAAAPPPIQQAPIQQAPVEQAPPPPSQEVFVRAEPPPARPVGVGKSGPTIASIASGTSQSGGSFYVQTGAFSTMNNAQRQRDLISSYGSTEIFQASAGGHEVYRVRVGPYTTPDAAGIVADRLKRSGYGEARVVAD
jgi:rare lipoprotein A